MKKSITIFVVCVAFFVQINQSAAKVPAVKDVLNDPNYEPLSPTARKLVETILGHLQFMLRNENASHAMITIAKNTEKILTTQTGQDNTMAILDLVGFFLKNPNASRLVAIWCEKADILVTTDQGREILRQAVLSLHRVMTSGNLIPFATAVLDGLETYLQSLEPKQLVKSLKIMQKYVIDTKDVTVTESDLQTREISDVFENSVRNAFEPTSYA